MASVDSTSDARTANNTMRHSYRVLSDAEKANMSSIKDKGLEFHDLIAGMGNSRELALAKTKIEEAVMWAVKHITAALLVAFLISALVPSAFAGDISPPATKAPPSLFTNSYPYGTSGLFVGLFTEGGSSAVTGSVAGVGSASLTSTAAGAGLTLGYSWGSKGSNIAYSVEGDFGWTNFNGSAPGLSFSGPAAFEQRFVAFTPLSTMLSFLPNFPSLGTIAPFNPLPTGVSASNLQVGMMAGLDETDISSNFVGVSSNREWRVAPMIGVVAMEQLSNGTAVRSWVKTVFPDKGVCAGPVANACINMGQTVKIGAGVYF